MSVGGRIAALRGRIYRFLVAESYLFFQRHAVRGNVVLYESFMGNGTVCHPWAIFEQLRRDPDFPHLMHVWAVSGRSERQWIHESLGRDSRVKIIPRRSIRYFRHLATAKYLINNSTFPTEFRKRDEQVYLNTWHGTPIKRMGFDRDLPGQRAHAARLAANTVSNFLAADYLVSSGPFMTRQMYERGYRLDGIWPGSVIEAGQPRTDVQRMPDARSRSREILRRNGLHLRGRKVALYAPTWRGSSFSEPDDPTEEAGRVLAALQAALGDEWIVLVKFHQATIEGARRSKALKRRIVPQAVPTNITLAATDLLVSDFSSIVLDFLASDSPMIFYAPDSVEYLADRGLYMDLESLPGPVVHDLEGLATQALAVAHGRNDSYATRREEWTRVYAPLDDGQATKRVIDAVFRGDPRHLVSLRTARPRLLFYLGDMRLNGITSSALSLLANLDKDRFDVTVAFGNPPDTSAWQCVERLPSEIRLIRRVGYLGVERWRRKGVRDFLETGIPDATGDIESMPYGEVFAREWKRIFGDADFDYVIDFSGYGPFWAFILLNSGPARRAIWLHNDMVADSQRTVNGVQNLVKKLPSTFSTYRFFDVAVSVSAALEEVNATSLEWTAPRSHFRHVMNMIEPGRIHALADLEPPNSHFAWLQEQKDDGAIVFVTIGRLSSEKNHRRLIEAFARVHATDPRTRLVIIGHGPLMRDLVDQVRDLDLVGAVHLAGEQQNPYAFLKASDCFVLPSDHEGQPMVILEALTLGLPVVTTDFSSSAGALPDGCGMIVPRSTEGVLDGMNAFLRGEVPVGEFRVESHNAQALREFMDVMELVKQDQPSQVKP